MNRTVLALATLMPLIAAAQTAAPQDADSRKTVNLDGVVVVASRAPEPLSQVVASVAQVERADIEQYLAHDLDGLTRYIPGISVTREGHRFGASGFAIRGLEGNRVRILVDGVPLADAYTIGQFASAGRDMVDLEVVERVEILRGPASTLYGSDALAGVVAFHTMDPEDLLARSGDHQYLGARLAWDGMDNSRLLAGQWAGEDESGRWQAMAVLGERRGHEADNRAWRAADGPNPADYRRRSALGKLVHDAGTAGRYVLAVDASRETRHTEVNSLRFGAGRYSTTYRLDGDDRDERSRLTFGAEWKDLARWIDALEAQAWLQDTTVRQDSAQYRLPDAATPFESLRWRRFDYDASATGLSVVGQARADGPFGRHWQVFGMDLVRQRYRGLRDGIETDLATGASSSVILGEPLPVRDFPTSAATTLALFWQDEISFARGLTLIPGLRTEWYRLQPKVDAIYREDFPDAEPAAVRKQHVTPRLGLRQDIGRNQHLFAQYARGFRAPPFGDVNIGLLLPVFNYEVRANPDLRPERSEGLELGWRHVGDSLRASVSLYENRYRDLIESRANLGIDPATRTLVFQSVNRDRARIRGVEADLLWRLDELGEALDGWELRGAAAWARGDDTRLQRPLNTIDPARGTIALRFAPPARHWGAEAAFTAVQRKSRIDHGGDDLFAPPGYARLDLYAWAEPYPGVRFNVGVVNLGNRRYWDWARVRGLEADARDLAAGDESIGFYTSPGRSLSASLALEW